MARAAKSTVGSLFRAQARLHPTHVALQDAAGTLDFATLDARTDRPAAALVARGVVAGARVAILAENRREYLELFLAAAKVGVAVACQNWRLAPITT